MAKGFKGPITWRLFRGLHISNPSLLNMFGSIMGGALKFLKPQRFREIKQVWDEHCSSYKKREFNQFIACYMIYGVLPEEYICYRFGTLNDTGRREYLSEFSRHELYDTCNDFDELHCFENKYETFELYKEFFLRDALLIDGNVSEVIFDQFVKAHKKFICKPLKLYLGIGIEVIDSDRYDSASQLLSYIRQKGECIIEELIIQSEDLSKFHKESVNTIRIPTIRTKEGIKLLDPFFKTGTGKSNVDNAGAGGVFAAIDKKSGIITTVGIDEKGNEYLRHPDSGLVFPGFQLPNWDQALDLVEKLMMIKPEIRYVGWDLAHTSKGWVVVEGNHEGQLVGQMPLHRGCAKEAKMIMERL